MSHSFLHFACTIIYDRLKCITCDQRWTGDTIADMGKECAAFVCQEYPDDVPLKIFALGVKCLGIVCSDVCLLTEEKKCAAEEFLSTIQETFSGEESIPAALLPTKTYAHSYLGRIASERHDPVDAIKHYTQSLDCLRSLGCGENDVDMMQLQMEIAQAQCALRGGDATAINATLLPFMKAIFDKSRGDNGEESWRTLENGYTLASILYELEQFNEAKQLIPELRLNARRVLGAHHYLTQQIEELGVSVL